MDSLLFLIVIQFLIPFAFAGTLPQNWRDFIDPDILNESGNDQSRYSSDRWEGDVSSLEPGERPANVAANAVDNADSMWPNNTIPYVFTTEHTADYQSLPISAAGLAERTKITEAMEIIMHLTGQCIKFVERTSETDYIKFTKGYQCFSDVGRTGGKQVLSLSFGCVERYGCIQHELMHVLGFYHEQSRSDRDDYVTINWDNIAEGNKVQFTKHAGNTYGLPYDYESIMHYQFNAFAEDDQFPTTLPKVRGTRLGQKENLSPLDVTRIHKRSKCRVPDGSNFVSSRPKETSQTKTELSANKDTPEVDRPEPFPIFSAEPMTREQCSHQFNANCASSGFTDKNCTRTQALLIECNKRTVSRQLQDMAAGMSKAPLRAIQIFLFDGDQLSYENFAVIKKQIIAFRAKNCTSSRTTAKLPQLRFTNLLSFALNHCYGMRIKRADFAQSMKVREIALWNTTVETLERETFTDLPALKLLSLEWGFSKMSAFSASVGAYLKRLHCDCEFSWYRQWWSSNVQLLRKAAQGEIYMIPASWRNPAWSKEEIYLPVECSSLPFPSGAASIDFTQQRFSINDDSDFGSELSRCMNTSSEAAESFPVFSEEPMTSEQCALQFTTNCAPYGMTRSNCTAYRHLDISCNREVNSAEIRLMALALAKTTPRPTKIYVYDGLGISFPNFAPIREQIVLFYLYSCKGNRGTSKPYELRVFNLVFFRLLNCYSLNIAKRDFQRMAKLRVIELNNSTVLTMEMGSFADLPSLRILALEYGLKNFPSFSSEVRNHLFRLHCSCEFAWYRRWWNSNTALVRRAESGEIFVLPGAWANDDYVREDIYLPIDCLALPSGSASINLAQTEFSLNDECRSSTAT